MFNFQCNECDLLANVLVFESCYFLLCLNLSVFGDCFLNDGNGSSHFMLTIIMAVILYENKL